MKPQEKNFETLLDMIDASEVREDDETYMNPIDRLFEALEKKESTHFAVKQYKKYKLAKENLAKKTIGWKKPSSDTKKKQTEPKSLSGLLNAMITLTN